LLPDSGSGSSQGNSPATVSFPLNECGRPPFYSFPAINFIANRIFLIRNKVLRHISANTSPPLLTGLPYENVLKVWSVVKPDETVMIIQQGSLGSFLTDRNGKTLYFFTKDTAGTSTCPGTCLAKWPAFSADPVSAHSVLTCRLQFRIQSRWCQTDGLQGQASLLLC
jgi:hypothetical protein